MRMGLTLRMWVASLLLLTHLLHGALCWGDDGHYAVCKIAQGYFEEETVVAVKKFLPAYADGELAAVCSWPDEIKRLPQWKWTAALHFADTPDDKCNYDYSRDCPNDWCVTGAIFNYTNQLMSASKDSQSIVHYNLTEALMFLSHYMGDIHQPLHEGFLGDLGGNKVKVNWYNQETNLHRVWDDMIIESALEKYYFSSLSVMIHALQDKLKISSESIDLACKYAYRNATAGTTLGDGFIVENVGGKYTPPYTSRPWSSWLGSRWSLRCLQDSSVKKILPAYANGELAAVCSWPDEIKRRPEWSWTYALHFVNTPDNECNYEYSRDCHNDKCVTGAIFNYTSQLMFQFHYNLTEALMFVSHFMGDIHQPLHEGFVGDQGGNKIKLNWYEQETNLHRVWDNKIIESAQEKYYNSSLSVMIHSLQHKLKYAWSNDVPSWDSCPPHETACPNPYASESIDLACKYAYKDAAPGTTLGDDYFLSRLPIVEKRIAQGGIRLAATLNRIFSPKPSLAAA
ncbi:hypothetical protein HID58_029578 [Brassica napus]|uniref:Aspergillus nuclease S1 n=1 Tax=Brassica napus TaxID=3708 RepID=A0ABQ8CDH1_BRANA|nr:hypothetical protein HID58_029578 [Brassica napus]